MGASDDRITSEHAAHPAALVLAATVARRHYVDGVTKREIAGELGLSRFKVARLLEHARATGIVRIEIQSPGQIDLDLSVRLSAAYGLRHCVVMDGPEDDDRLLRASLGRAAAELLTEIVEPGDVLGLACARSLMAMRTSLTRLARCDVIQLAGALALPAGGSPVELVRDVARWSAGQAYFYDAPMIVPDAATARALSTQPQLARAVGRFGELTKAVVGVGAWRAGLSAVADALDEQERGALYDLGVRGELAGIQLDQDGNALTTPLNERLIAIGAEQLRAVPEVIGIVYGAGRAGAVRAALRGGFLTSVVTHPEMARQLLQRA